MFEMLESDLVMQGIGHKLVMLRFIPLQVSDEHNYRELRRSEGRNVYSGDEGTIIEPVSVSNAVWSLVLRVAIIRKGS